MRILRRCVHPVLLVVLLALALALWGSAPLPRASGADRPVVAAYAPLVISAPAAPPTAGPVLLTDCGASTHAGWDCGLVDASAGPDGAIYVTYQVRPKGQRILARLIGTHLVDVQTLADSSSDTSPAPALEYDAEKTGDGTLVVTATTVVWISQARPAGQTSGAFGIYLEVIPR